MLRRMETRYTPLVEIVLMKLWMMCVCQRPARARSVAPNGTSLFRIELMEPGTHRCWRLRLCCSDEDACGSTHGKNRLFVAPNRTVLFFIDCDLYVARMEPGTIH